jgi:hypothetical protein
MEVLQGNSLGSSLKLKMSCFSSLLFLYKIGKQDGGTSPGWKGEWRVGTSEKGEEVGKW